jgi:hypothetical protein
LTSAIVVRPATIAAIAASATTAIGVQVLAGFGESCFLVIQLSVCDIKLLLQLEHRRAVS